MAFMQPLAAVTAEDSGGLRAEAGGGEKARPGSAPQPEKQAPRRPSPSSLAPPGGRRSVQAPWAPDPEDAAGVGGLASDFFLLHKIRICQ